MLPVNQAEALILQQIVPLGPAETEQINLGKAWGRILATPVRSSLDFPHWDNSAMDGYAVRWEDVAIATPEQPVSLTIVEDIPAGAQPQTSVQSGQAARILTGSMMPAGADTVVMQEVTRREGDQVRITTAPAQLGAFVRQRAAFYQAGQPLLPVGSRIQAPELAILAAAQCVDVTVYRSLRVAILSTGSELVSPEQSLQPGQIVDSNQYALTALVAQAGAMPLPLGIVPDDRGAIAATLTEALTSADVILSSGGVSVGDYDYIDQILAELQAEIHLRAVAVRPGKPLTFATFPGPDRPLLYFGLPGNPVSAFVTFWRFVQPALKKLSGLGQGWEPRWIQAKTAQPLRSDGKRETYLWGRLHWHQGQPEFQLAAGSQNSANLINLAHTDALAQLPVGQTAIAPGDWVTVLALGP